MFLFIYFSEKFITNATNKTKKQVLMKCYCNYTHFKQPLHQIKMLLYILSHHRHDSFQKSLLQIKIVSNIKSYLSFDTGHKSKNYILKRYIHILSWHAVMRVAD